MTTALSSSVTCPEDIFHDCPPEKVALYWGSRSLLERLSEVAEAFGWVDHLCHGVKRIQSPSAYLSSGKLYEDIPLSMKPFFMSHHNVTVVLLNLFFPEGTCHLDLSAIGRFQRYVDWRLDHDASAIQGKYIATSVAIHLPAGIFYVTAP